MSAEETGAELIDGLYSRSSSESASQHRENHIHGEPPARKKTRLAIELITIYGKVLPKALDLRGISYLSPFESAHGCSNNLRVDSLALKFSLHQ